MIYQAFAINPYFSQKANRLVSDNKKSVTYMYEHMYEQVVQKFMLFPCSSKA